jgi:hypothetical protein
MSPRLTALSGFALVGAALAFAACSDMVAPPPAGRAPIAGTDTLRVPDTAGVAQRTLLECPTLQTISNSALITTLGGSVTAAGTSITLPAGALLASTFIRVTVPASTYMEVDITANDLATFVFAKRATVTIDYSRCPTSVTAGKALSVWHIDTQTKALRENMQGTNDPAARRITFTTSHLSGYAIAQ